MLKITKSICSYFKNKVHNQDSAESWMGEMKGIILIARIQQTIESNIT